MENVNLTLLPMNEIQLEVKFKKWIVEALKDFNPSQQLPNPTELLNLKQTCELLNLAPATIYGLINQNKIPYHKQAGAKNVRFIRSEILQWLETGRPTTAEQKAEEYLSKKFKKIKIQ